MIKKLYIFSIFMTLFLTGCAVDEWYAPEHAENRDYAEFSFAVPEPTIVETRAITDDGAVSSAYVFFFANAENLADCELLQKNLLSFSDGVLIEKKVKYESKLKDHLNSDGNNGVKVVAVANSDLTSTQIDGIKNLQQLQAMASEVGIESRSNLIMSGVPYIGDERKEVLTQSQLNKPVAIHLYRNAAKAVVTLDNNANTKDFELTGYGLYSYAKKGYLTAGAYTATDPVKPLGETGYTEYSNITAGPSYGYGQTGYADQSAAKSNLGKDQRAHVIVEGNYKNQKCYYRVDLLKKTKENGQEKSEYLFLTPNYRYDIKIIKVRCKGYADPTEASRHPMTDFIEVEIHDHAEKILSMTSDGLRELGVTSEVHHKNSDDDGKNFTLKLFSKVSDSEYPTMTKTGGKYVDNNESRKFSMEVIEGGDWLSLGTVSSPASDNSGEAATGAGRLYTVGLNYGDTKFTGEMEGIIRITWKGLQRDVKVIWNKTFNPSALCTVSLEIKNGSADDWSNTGGKIDDYWKFLDGTGSSKNSSSEKYSVFGVSKEQNNGQIRNQGFHLPLMYGGSSDASQWTYVYTIKPIGTSKITNAVPATKGGKANAYENIDNFNNLKVSVSNNVVTLTATADEYDWTYKVGKLLITIDGVEYPFDLYHTGFFHNEKGGQAYGTNDNEDESLRNIWVDNYVGVQPAAGYYYYEVRTYKQQHWLDRNVCATAGAMAVRDNHGNDLIGDNKDKRFNSGAVGAYLTPANWKKYGNVENNIYDHICPPGFRIPRSDEWDKMRNSGRFITSETTVNGVPYFQSTFMDADGREMFFPKVLYKISSGLVGDSRAGYYWTSTAASGIEKIQIGRWMKAFYMTGASSTMINGAVNNYGMQIRAICSDEPKPASKTIGFKVKGATNVYIYDAGTPWNCGTDFSCQEHFDAQKYGLMTWPGQAIGEASTMRNEKGNSNSTKYPDQNGQEFTFTYTTTTDIANLRVLFTYVENGKIYVFDRVEEGDPKTGTDKYNGWPLLSGDNAHYEFEFQSNRSYVEKTVGGTVSSANYKYAIIWPKMGDDDHGFYRIYVEYDNNGGYAPGFGNNNTKYGHSQQYSELDKDVDPVKFFWLFNTAPAANKDMILYLRNEDGNEKTYKNKFTRDDFNQTMVIDGQNYKVLNLYNSKDDFVDGHGIGGGTVYTYEIQWPEIGTSGNDYYRIYLENTNGTKPADFSNGNPKDKTKETGSSPNKTFYYDFSTAPTSDMNMWIYNSAGKRKKYNGTISLSSFTVTEGTKKICKITNSSSFTDDNPDVDYSNVYVNVVGEWNNNNNGVNPDNSTGISKHEGLAIGNKKFIIKVWDVSDTYYSTKGTIQTDKWISVSSCNQNDTQMSISGASSGDQFDVEWDYNKKMIRVTKVGGNAKTLVIRVNNTHIGSVDYLYAWKSSTPYPSGGFNAAQSSSGTRDGYKYWKFTVSDDVSALDGVILKTVQNGDDYDNRLEFEGSDYFTKESASTASNFEGADYLFTINTTDYKSANWWVNVQGEWNWSDESAGVSAQPKCDGIARIKNVGIKNKRFQIRVWDGSSASYYAKGKINLNQWTEINTNESNMYVNGAGENSYYDVYFNVKTKKIKIVNH